MTGHCVCEAHPWDDRGDLVHITRDKSMDVEGASKRPDAIEYLSAHCDLSTLNLGLPLEALKVPVSEFPPEKNP